MINNKWFTLSIAGVLGFAAVVLSQPVAADGIDRAASPPSAAAVCGSENVTELHGTWTVSPNGVDDTANLECALNQADVRVKLTEGTFYTDFFVVEDFDGRLRGAGRDLTTIEPLPGGLDCQSVFDEFGFVFWMVFLGSNPTITDLRLSIPDVACETPYDEFEVTDPESGETVFSGSFQDFNAMVLMATRSPEPTNNCGSSIEGGLTAKRIDVDAPEPDFDAPVFNPQGAFNSFLVVGTTPVNCDVADRVIGDVTVTDVEATGVGNLINAESVTNSRIRVMFNRTVNTDSMVILTANSGSRASVHSNHVENASGGGFFIDNCLNGDPSQCSENPWRLSIMNNSVDVRGIGFAGVAASDFGDSDPALELRVRNNQITTNGNFAGVAVRGVEGARITYNTLIGASVFGVILEEDVTQSRIVGNDLTAHESFEADILLAGPTSFNVVKRNYGALVADFGSDNTVVEESPAPAV